MKINKKRETTADLRHADDIMGVTIDTPKCVSVYKKHQGWAVKTDTGAVLQAAD